MFSCSIGDLFFRAKSSSTLRPFDVKSWDFLLYFSDGLTDCEDPECCENPVCRKSQLCHTVPFPIDILLRKQPPSATASFFERMKFIIEDKGLQSYVEKAGFNERYVENVILFFGTQQVVFTQCENLRNFQLPRFFTWNIRVSKTALEKFLSNCSFCSSRFS